MLKSGEFESSIVFIFFNNFSVLARVKLMQKHTKLMTLFLAMTLLIGCASEPVRKTHTSQKDQSNTTPSQSKVVSKAQSYYQKGDFKNAIATLDSVSMSEVPLKERSEFWNLKGLVELNHKQFALASQNFKHAIEENQQPEYRGYYQYNLATAHFGAGQYQESYDILAAVDLGSIDQPQQHKVLTLKEKASQALKIPQKKTVTTTITGSPDATNQGIGPVVITSPEVVYSGGVNRKKIGLLIPLSGKFEIFGKKVQRSIELAFQHSNDDRAKDYELIAVDSGDSAESQVHALTKLVEEHQVIAVIGPVISKGIELLASKAVYYQVPLISLAQVQSPLATHLFFCSISTQDQVSQTVNYTMGSKGYSKFAIIAPSNKPGEEMAQTFKNEVLARNGEVIHQEFYDPNITDFRASVDKILSLDHPEKRVEEQKELAKKRKELKITRKTTRTAQYYNLPPIVDFDAVFIADEAKTAGQIIPTFTYRDAKNLKYIGITSWNSSQLVQRAQEQAEDAIFPVAFNTIQASNNTKAFFDLYTSNFNSTPGELDAISFDAASLVIQGLRNSPSTRDEFRTILEGTAGIQGATGEFSIQDRRCVRSLSMVEVHQGKFVIVNEK
jgi:ABC-type branched-subunit amino acid transport system substrate-binding protein